MKISYKNKKLESTLIVVKAITSAVVVASFVVLFGFDEPLLPMQMLYQVQLVTLFIFIAGKFIRGYNAVSIKEFLIANWYEIPLLIALAVIIYGSNRWFTRYDPEAVRHLAVGIYLIIEVITKICRTTVRLAATGRNTMKMLVTSFLVLIIVGAGMLMLPKASTNENLSFVDALFTSTSATCVTGLIVKDTGSDFTLMGQLIILTLIQLGGLGIVVFGAVFALLLGQAFSLRESVAMQDLVSASTLSRIGKMIAFIFIGTLVFEAIGAISLFRMFDDVPGRVTTVEQQWFFSIFHSISAFCNAGFSLFTDGLVSYNKSLGPYMVICPLIILGGLGFGVLYDLSNIFADRINRFFKKTFIKKYKFSMEAPKRIGLQTKIVLSSSALLIVFGALAIVVLENFAATPNSAGSISFSGALFQSITARTAGFNTVDIAALSPSSKFVTLFLMFIGGSPGGTAGGIKTVTLVVIVLAAFATLRKRNDVEIFNRSIHLEVVRRAITVTLLFILVLFVATLALNITESKNGFTMSDIIFEAGSALGTVGLTTGKTASLTAIGKLIIIVTMLIGRLGPLTLLAALTFNMKPAKYNYPNEPVIVG